MEQKYSYFVVYKNIPLEILSNALKFEKKSQSNIYPRFKAAFTQNKLGISYTRTGPSGRTV
jgi:hypothetical protein